jgi:hypothetical protein
MLGAFLALGPEAARLVLLNFRIHLTDALILTFTGISNRIVSHVLADQGVTLHRL